MRQPTQNDAIAICERLDLLIELLRERLPVPCEHEFIAVQHPDLPNTAYSVCCKCGYRPNG
jgi:hypothetical protein